MPKTETDTTNAAIKKSKITGTQISLFLLAIVVAFIAGTRSDYIVATLRNQTPAGELDLSSVQDVYKTLATNYDGELDQQKLIDGAKKGLVEGANDQYTVYFTEEEAKEFLGDLEGTFEGIGAELGVEDGRLIIVNPLDGSPAKKSGLKAKDSILTVNGEDAADWSVEKAVSKIRGEKGTTVKLGIVRDGKPKEISVVRGTISVPSVETEITDNNIGIIRISRFGQTETASLVRKAADEFTDAGVKGIVLDMRGNGGGYLNSAVDVASLWMENKVVVTERTNGKVRDELRTSGDAPFQGIDTVVLVDGGTASASEILAGALRDNGAATIVGEQTFGKGVVQDIKQLDDGGSLKVTIASWFTPNGNNISKEGIKPDTTIKFTEADAKADRDPQRAKALELLK